MSLTLRKIALAGVAMGVIGATGAEAAPVRVTAPAAIGFDQGSGGVKVDTVQYRRRYYGGGRYYGRRGYGAGPAIAAGAALGLLGAGIAAAAAPSYGYGYGGGYPAYGYGGYGAYGGYPAYGYSAPAYGYYGW